MTINSAEDAPKMVTGMQVIELFGYVTSRPMGIEGTHDQGVGLKVYAF